MPHEPHFLAPISAEIWDLKYRLKTLEGAPVDATLDDTVWRVARAAAAPEKGGKRVKEKWARSFHDAIADFGFLPAGRILAGAGTGRSVTLFNCFVLGTIADDLGAIFEGVKEAALTMQQGGGIGHDFSTLRPQGARVASIGADASGPVSFMDVWDAMCRTIMSAGSRRGAMMATLRCDHPDIELFIDAKSDPRRLRNFNLSVLVTDAFLKAVREDGPWDLKFGGKVYRTIAARALWERIMQATYDYAEPGVLFIDRVNARNNLKYCEEIHATNPCGEQPLPPYGACLLGSINLASLVEHPFTNGATLDVAKLETRVRLAVRFLDNVIDISNYPLEAAAQGGLGQAPHRAGCDRPRRRPDLLRRHLRHQGSRRACRQVDGGHPERRLPRQHRARRREGHLPAVRCRALSRRPQRGASGRARARGNPSPRHAQRLPHLHRAHRHHLAARRQCVERHRARLRFPLPPPRAGP